MSTDDSNSTATSIKNLRKKLGISQLEFENQLGIANGSLSKIEAGKTTPTHETLLRIISTFNLSTYESCTLLGLPMHKVTSVIDLVNELHALETETDVAQKAANVIPHSLDLLGASVNLVFGDELKTVAFTQSWYTEFLLNLMPFQYRSFSVSMSKHKYNLMVQSINECRLTYGVDLAEFTSPYMSPHLARMLQRTAGVRSIVSIPMFLNREPLGAILYVKNVDLSFTEEIPLLESLTDSVASVIYRLRTLKKIQERYVS